METTKQTDFEVQNHGSIYLLEPCTEAADDWVADHIPDDAMTWGKGIVAEPRYIHDIVEGILEDGLSVS